MAGSHCSLLPHAASLMSDPLKDEPGFPALLVAGREKIRGEGTFRRVPSGPAVWQSASVSEGQMGMTRRSGGAQLLDVCRKPLGVLRDRCKSLARPPRHNTWCRRSWGDGMHHPQGRVHLDG